MEKFMFGGSSIMDLYLVWSIFDSCLLAVLINIFYMVDWIGCSETLHTYEKIWISVERFWCQESSLTMIVVCCIFNFWNLEIFTVITHNKVKKNEEIMWENLTTIEL
jgi:hypothetical protein